MNYSVQIVVFEGENEKNRLVKNNSSTGIKSDKDLTVGELKEKCKEWYGFPSTKIVVEEKLYKGNKEITDNNEVLGIAHGLEYNIVIK
jgi:hypothetical protein